MQLQHSQKVSRAAVSRQGPRAAIPFAAPSGPSTSARTVAAASAATGELF